MDPNYFLLIYTNKTNQHCIWMDWKPLAFLQFSQWVTSSDLVTCICHILWLTKSFPVPSPSPVPFSHPASVKHCPKCSRRKGIWEPTAIYNHGYMIPAKYITVRRSLYYLDQCHFCDIQPFLTLQIPQGNILLSLFVGCGQEEIILSLQLSWNIIAFESSQKEAQYLNTSSWLIILLETT